MYDIRSQNGLPSIFGVGVVQPIHMEAFAGDFFVEFRHSNQLHGIDQIYLMDVHQQGTVYMHLTGNTFAEIETELECNEEFSVEQFRELKIKNFVIKAINKKILKNKTKLQKKINEAKAKGKEIKCQSWTDSVGMAMIKNGIDQLDLENQMHFEFLMNFEFPKNWNLIFAKKIKGKHQKEDFITENNQKIADSSFNRAVLKENSSWEKRTFDGNQIIPENRIIFYNEVYEGQWLSNSIFGFIFEGNQLYLYFHGHYVFASSIYYKDGKSEKELLHSGTFYFFWDISKNAKELTTKKKQKRKQIIQSIKKIDNKVTFADKNVSKTVISYKFYF